MNHNKQIKKRKTEKRKRPWLYLRRIVQPLIHMQHDLIHLFTCILASQCIKNPHGLRKCREVGSV